MARSRAPIRHTCPDIDKGIDRANEVISMLEKLRESNDALRVWGDEEAQRVDELEVKVDELETTISDMQATIDDLTAELKEAQLHD